MKKILVLFLLGFACSVSAFVVGGSEDYAVTHTPEVIMFGGAADAYVYLYNTGTSSVFYAFGGRIDPGEEESFPVLKSGASIMVQGVDYYLMTVATKTNEATTVDYGFGGK